MPHSPRRSSSLSGSAVTQVSPPDDRRTADTETNCPSWVQGNSGGEAQPHQRRGVSGAGRVERRAGVQLHQRRDQGGGRHQAARHQEERPAHREAGAHRVQVGTGAVKRFPQPHLRSPGAQISLCVTGDCGST